MSKRVKIILGIVGVVVIAGTAATIAFWPAISGFVSSIFGTRSQDVSEEDQPAEPVPTVDIAITQKANLAKNTAGPAAAIAVYDEAIANTDDSKQSAALYSKKAEVQVSAGDSAGAITSALTSIEVGGENVVNTSFLASLYEQEKNYAEAAKYYKKAADLVPSDDLFQSKEYYQSKAVEMEAL